MTSSRSDWFENERAERGVRFLALKRQAEEKVLLVSPPYEDGRVRGAFLSGYEAALRDIAHGWLKP